MSRWHSTLRAVSWTLASCALALAALTYVSYRRDCGRLRRVAVAVTQNATSSSAQVLALLDWTYGLAGFKHNQRYFLIPRMGATPVQVLKEGGDCTDRSRLLCALLRELAIPATMAMCFDPRSGKPTHTFVDARIEGGAFMAVDPAYGLYFPKSNGAGYHGLLALRQDPDIVKRRVDELIARMPSAHPYAGYYLRSTSSYNRVGTINWNKTAATRLIRDGLRAWFGERIYRLPRPIVLEEPKLLVATFCLLAIGFSLFPWACSSWLTRGRQSRRLRRPEPAAPTRATAVLAGSSGRRSA